MSTEAPPKPSSDPYLEMQRSAEFAGLRKALRSFVFPMTVAFFVWYALYVILSAYARGFMSTKLVGHINVALVFGLLQFVSTFLIAWLYERYSARRLDPVAEELKERTTALVRGAAPDAPIESGREDGAQ
jgi:uncharacterized membrane protein (DUF485 family)